MSVATGPSRGSWGARLRNPAHPAGAVARAPRARRRATRHRVAVRGTPPLHVDVRLYRESISRVETQREVFPHRDHRDGRLMPETRRLLREIAAVELRMIAALPDELHVREAKADGIDAHKELVQIGRAHV